MPEYDLHDPDSSGRTESEWDAPRMENFETDDLPSIDDHFLLTPSGFPPEDFGDLALPIGTRTSRSERLLGPLVLLGAAGAAIAVALSPDCLVADEVLGRLEDALGRLERLVLEG